MVALSFEDISCRLDALIALGPNLGGHGGRAWMLVNDHSPSLSKYSSAVQLCDVLEADEESMCSWGGKQWRREMRNPAQSIGSGFCFRKYGHAYFATIIRSSSDADIRGDEYISGRNSFILWNTTICPAIDAASTSSSVSETDPMDIDEINNERQKSPSTDVDTDIESMPSYLLPNVKPINANPPTNHRSL
jgi:hypothetical protein